MQSLLLSQSKFIFKMYLQSFVFTSVFLLIQQYADKYREQDLVKTLDELENDLNVPRIQTYDFIVVGGGTAGCLVAGRLSEHYKVLLLEQGGSPVPATNNPFLNGVVYTHPEINSKFIWEHNGKMIQTDMGRMLGGSGSHNGNFYNRGSPHDYDYFANVTKDESWKYENILQHFKRFENFIGQLLNEGERKDFFSTGGPLTVDAEMSPIIPAWFQAASELGFQTMDPNTYQREGFTNIMMSMKNGQRESTYTAFIKPFESSRSNLEVLRYSEVEKVLVNNEKTAYGVLFKRHGIPQIAHATKEIIITGGAFQSPLLLLKSGIGPRPLLEEAQIPIVLEVPGVGQNLQDHSAVIMNFIVNSPNSTFLPLVEDSSLENELNKFQDTPRTGLMTQMDVHAQAFITSSRAKQDGEGEWPDYQLVFQQTSLIKGESQETAFNIHVVLNRAKSFGSISLDATKYLNGIRDDRELALVDLDVFRDPSDVQVLVEAVKQAMIIAEETTPFKAMQVSFIDTSPEICKSFVFRSDEFWDCFVREKGEHWRHFVGTCKMGADDDSLAVLDPNLKVRGINGLRVADASVMPQPTNANLNAGVMLVAEKVSQDILQEHGTDTSSSESSRMKCMMALLLIALAIHF